MQGNVGDDLVCASIRPDGSCTARFPHLVAIAALGGWEVGRHRAGTARVLVGPAVYQGAGTRALGGQLRAWLATPAPSGVALVGFARGAAGPRLGGSRLALGAVGIGLRVHKAGRAARAEVP